MRNNECILPTLHGVNTTIDLARDALKGKYIYSHELIKSMYEGVDQKPLTNPKYQNYYDIFNNDYSHANILYTNPVVEPIHKILKEN